jgi:hypothetical protein
LTQHATKNDERGHSRAKLRRAGAAVDQFQSFGRFDELFESKLLSNPPTMAPPT